MYSDLFLQPQRKIAFPRVFVVAVVALFGLMVGQVFFWYASVPSQASSARLVQETPVNITDVEATIFFETNEPVGASILYGETPQKLNIPAFRSGDKPGKYAKSKYHLISLSGLQPQTEYYYKILADDKLLTLDEAEAFSFTTDSQRSLALGGRQPLYGKVVTPDGAGLGNVYVIVHIPGIDKKPTFSAVSKDSGEWLITVPTTLQGADPITIDFIHENYPRSHVVSVVEKSAPTPQSIVIGQDYTFTSESNNILPASTKRSQDPSYTISLLYPTRDAVIPNTRPLFKGFGIPKTTVIVRVSSKPQYEGSAVINDKGTWLVEASRPFAPGSYVVSVDLVDNLGQPRTITRSFVIAKSGEQVLGESVISTPSGTLTPTSILSVTQTPTQPVVVTSTPAPTGVVYITATPNPTILNSITPTELEKSGGEIPLSWIVFGSLFLSGGIVMIRFYPSSIEH